MAAITPFWKKTVIRAGDKKTTGEKESKIGLK